MDHRDAIIIILGVMWWLGCVLSYNWGWCDGASKYLKEFIEDIREGEVDD